MVNGPFEFQDFCRDTTNNRIWRNIFIDNRSGSYYCASANGYSRQECDVTANPDILLYSYISIISCRLVVLIYISYEFTDYICMISGLNSQPTCNCAIPFAIKFCV